MAFAAVRRHAWRDAAAEATARRLRRPALKGGWQGVVHDASRVMRRLKPPLGACGDPP
jgi:hypothetical protein